MSKREYKQTKITIKCTLCEQEGELTKREYNYAKKDGYVLCGNCYLAIPIEDDL